MKFFNILFSFIALISMSSEKAVNDVISINTKSNANAKNLNLIMGLWDSTEQTKPLTNCSRNSCILHNEGFSWNIIFNGASCVIHSLTAGANDYITNKGAKSGSVNVSIDMNGSLRCKFKGIDFEDVRKINISGSMKNTSQNFFTSTYIELYHININNQVLRNGVNSFYRNGLDLKITLGECDSTWSYGVSNPNNCHHSSWVVGDSKGQCGKFGNSYYFCKENHCCSKHGYCGVTSEYCKAGCQSTFGLCQ